MSLLSGLKSHKLYFDGSCEPVNPNGVMGMGFVLYDQHEKIVNKHSSKEYLGEGFDKTSNNLAEYLALKRGLEYCLSKKVKTLAIYGDSMLVVKQMRAYTSNSKGETWRIKGGIYKQTANECIKLLEQFSFVTLDWIPREKNTIADELSK